ncbi:hypothetical protein, partial [Streptomyces sp. NPDC059883]|uniref:hypothetical protein n=1 Tax=unclassified Streptomyces TaxID=2593676 RepID=UPI003663CA90
NPPVIRQVGVSTYLALTFGTLLSSQGTDASFGPVSGPSGLFPSVLRFRLYQIHSACSAFRIPMAFGLAFCLSAVHYFNRIPARLIIEPLSPDFGMPKSLPVRVWSKVVGGHLGDC